MIAFSRLGAKSRLGNHLFQYAFLRSTAARLDVGYFCPVWRGDQIFNLKEDGRRFAEYSELPKKYVEPGLCPGFNPPGLQIFDGTDIEGYFQSDKYFSRDEVLSWYEFKEETVAQAKGRFAGVDFDSCAALSIRLGDFVSTYFENFYVPRRSFFEDALRRVSRNETILVFSDDFDAAEKYLHGIGANFVFARGCSDVEQLFLMSQCRDCICSPSTFSWWGAYLIRRPDAVIIAPREGPFRLGSKFQNPGFWPEGWVLLGSQHALLDHRLVVMLRHWIRRAGTAFARRLRILS